MNDKLQDAIANRFKIPKPGESIGFEEIRLQERLKLWRQSYTAAVNFGETNPGDEADEAVDRFDRQFPCRLKEV